MDCKEIISIENGIPEYDVIVLLFTKEWGWEIGNLRSTDSRGHHFEDREGNSLKPTHWTFLPDNPK